MARVAEKADVSPPATRPGRGASSWPLARERQGRELASANLKARAKDARVQVSRLSAAISDNACCDLQRVRFAATHDQPADAPVVPCTGALRLGEGGRLSGIPRPERKSLLPSYADSSLSTPIRSTGRRSRFEENSRHWGARRRKPAVAEKMSHWPDSTAR